MNYYYLVASLPRLMFGAEKLPIQRQVLEERLRDNLSSDDAALYAATAKDFYAWEQFAPKSRFLSEYTVFERNLRNFLVSVNTKKTGKDAAAFAGEIIFSGQVVEFIGRKQYLELERFLDRARFEKIDEINRFHYFDADRIFGYSLQLALLERWAGLLEEKGIERLRELSEKDIGKKELYEFVK